MKLVTFPRFPEENRTIVPRSYPARQPLPAVAGGGGDFCGAKLVPVKAAVQRAEGIGEGAVAEVALRLDEARRE